jgi:hypothetical protein
MTFFEKLALDEGSIPSNSTKVLRNKDEEDISMALAEA